MATKNLIYKHVDHNDEDQESLSSPCFGIGPEVQLKDVPTTGEEYLLQVMKERKKCLTITIWKEDYSKFAKNQSRFVEEFPCAKVPDELKPTIEWQNIQVADFSDVRMYISRLLAKRSLWKHKIKGVEVQGTSRDWKMFFEDKDPTLSCVLGLHLSMLDRGMEVLTEILGEVQRGHTIPYKIGQWIYAFLACTRQPLLSDTTSILRDLARKCAEIRFHINPDDDNARNAVTPLNIFICLIARYFRQYDLAD